MHVLTRLLLIRQAFLELTAADPMAADEYDADEYNNCRSELIQTQKHGAIFARMSGDPSDPLILYLHGAGTGERACSHAWNKDVHLLSSQLRALNEPAPKEDVVDPKANVRGPCTLPPPPGAHLPMQPQAPDVQGRPTRCPIHT